MLSEDRAELKEFDFGNIMVMECVKHEGPKRLYKLLKGTEEDGKR